MADPIVVPRSEHSLSRSHIDPDALKVLYRLHKFDHIAYMVGGSVRDLLIGRRPKDFDIGTSAHPNQIKRLFRNCWIIGRRFRLAHVKFGPKTIEVATFRKLVTPGSEGDPDPAPPADSESTTQPQPGSRVIQRDNTFGTPEEDAFRRDFTVNALFYDIATFSIIDYVGGLKDLEAGLIRCIGDPGERFLEDPVRMLRAVALAARLDFKIERPIMDAIAKHRAEIRQAAPPRMLEELYKILRGGSAERTLRDLGEARLLAQISPELHRHRSDAMWRSLHALDAYRARFDSAPATLTNPILLGSLVAPIGLLPGRHADPLTLGALPVARGQVESLRQIISMQDRLLDPELPERAKRGLTHRSVFDEALTWLEIHGGAPVAHERWRDFVAHMGERPAPTDRRPRRPRRRRRRKPRTTEES
jgi:poly(A) polymerase